MNPVIKWFNRNLSNPQVVSLLIIVSLFLLAVMFMSEALAPVMASVVIAYVLDGVVARLKKCKIPKTISIWLVFSGFFAVLIVLFFGLAPIIFNQIAEFMQQLPSMINEAQKYLSALPHKYPQLIEEKQIKDLMSGVRADAANLGQKAVAYSVTSLLALGTFVVYLILVPLMVYFFLTDKEKILNWFLKFLPEDRGLVARIWFDANNQFASYIRGKVWEIVIVGIFTYITFAIIGLKYSALLALLTGFSVLIPYIGAAVVTFPVMAVAFFQFGFAKEFTTAVIAYGVIQAIDGNILSTLLLSEVVKLHPVAIVVAILIFGSFWGFWGVFFAIPLATLVQAILKAWPSEESHNEQK